MLPESGEALVHLRPWPTATAGDRDALMHCTQCGAQAQGRFCASCGASLKALSCRSCGAATVPGTRFCTSCGAGVGGAKTAGPRRRGSASAGSAAAKQGGLDAGWWVAGGLLVVTLLVVGVGMLMDWGAGAVPAAPGAALGTAGGTPPDLSAMSPREAADRLFNRVMAAAARNDTGEANTFLPMAMDAYELARPLDVDGLFHLSLLQRAANEYEDALATSLEGLAANPDHLLNLSSAAESSLQLGRADEGQAHYERLLSAWDEEIAVGRQEYEEHAPLLPLIREDAEAVLFGEAEP